MGRSAEFAGGAFPCPECGSAGKPDGGSNVALSHAGETPGHCRTYTWDRNGTTIARDISTKAERDARSDAIDARLRRLNPFRSAILR